MGGGFTTKPEATHSGLRNLIWNSTTEFFSRWDFRLRSALICPFAVAAQSGRTILNQMHNDSGVTGDPAVSTRTTLPPRLVGRFAGALFLGSGALNLLSLLAPPRPGLVRWAQVLISLIALAAGLAAWVFPWGRPGSPSTLWLAPLGLGLISAGHFFGGGPNASVGLFYAVFFVWVGLTQGRWASIRLAPLALVAYLLPLLKPVLRSDSTTIALTIPLVILVGEVVGWVASRLRSTEDLLFLEQDAARRLQEIEETKTALLTAASHEVLTPLVSIMRYADVLRKQAGSMSPEEVADSAERLVLNTQRLDRLVRGLLDADRIAAGLIDARPEPTDLWRLMTRVVERLSLRHHHLEFHTEVPVANLDPGLTERIIENLLANAVGYAPQGARISLTITNQPEGLLITTANEGVSVPDDQLERIFEAFERAPGHEHSPGMGLGLWIVRRFAETQGGRAWAEEGPHGGISFNVHLPVPEKNRSRPPRQ